MRGQRWFYLGTALVVLPFLVAACYNHPLGVHEWDWISNYFGKLDHLSYWEEQNWWYQNVMGRYANTALLSTTDSWYTLYRFRALFVFMIILFCAALWYFFRSIYQAETRTGALVSCGVIWVYFTGLTGVYDSIYRFSGILTYQLGLILLLGYFSELLRGLRRDKPTGWRLGILFLLSLLVPGFNEPVTFTGLLVLGFGLMFLKWQKQTVPFWLWVSAGLFLLGSCAEVFAPGNFTRMQAYGEGYSIFKAFALSIGVLGYQVVAWVADTLLIPMTILGLPILSKEAKSLSKLFHYPQLWLAGTALVLVAILFPLLYSTRGLSYPERIVDLMFVLFIIGWIGFVQSCLVVFQKNTYDFQPTYMRIVRMGLLIWILGNTWMGRSHLYREQKNAESKLDILQIGSPPAQLMLDIVTGKLSVYNQQMHNQYREIAQCQTDTCQISRPMITPAALYDIDSDRKSKPAGEPYQGSCWNKRIKIVLYKP